MLKEADAALVIGDPALRVALKMEALSAKLPGGGACCQGDPEDMPVPGFETVFVYDVAYQWREMTGKPCVLAIWAGRRDAITPEVVADFQASKQYGMERIREISEAASVKLDMPAKALERYLTDNIDFNLDEENLEGLESLLRKSSSRRIDSPQSSARIRRHAARAIDGSSRSLTPWSASANSAGCAAIL